LRGFFLSLLAPLPVIANPFFVIASEAWQSHGKSKFKNHKAISSQRSANA